ncbi:hypothetical protein CAEBREN_31408 [Caenorhabditis brenneri]|uniref:Uncharacterized protein n=1 Tax=Caenorhabditis brenneri TaxID=135651 RepID=G0ME83_CAEBE|nr:hypothetical protein CAEBREN_31408 [Caenorhabditis brenneri]
MTVCALKNQKKKERERRKRDGARRAQCSFLSYMSSLLLSHTTSILCEFWLLSPPQNGKKRGKEQRAVTRKRALGSQG